MSFILSKKTRRKFKNNLLYQLSQYTHYERTAGISPFNTATKIFPKF